MPQERVAVREIAWLEIFPWLILLRTFRIAMQPKMLATAALGVLLTWLGLTSLGYLFGGTRNEALKDQIKAVEANPLRWALPHIEVEVDIAETTTAAGKVVEERATVERVSADTPPIYWPWERLSRPFQSLFKADLTVSGFAFNFLAAVWVALVWTLCGGVICRTAAMQLAAEEKLPLGRALSHVRKKWLAYFLAPVGTLLAFLVIVCFVSLVGMLLRLEIGLFLGALVWPIVLLLGVLGTLILAGLFFGWPLMWAVVGVEHSDHYDALSRSFTYVLSRPLHYLFYLVVVTAIGALGWLAAAAFAETVIYLSAWATCRFAHEELLGQIMSVVPHPWPGELSLWPAADLKDVDGPAWAGLRVIQFWASAVCLLVAGFVYSYFWTAAVGCYLLLRYHVDGNELDDIVLDEEDEPRELAPLETDEKGVPIAPEDSVGPPSGD